LKSTKILLLLLLTAVTLTLFSCSSPGNEVAGDETEIDTSETQASDTTAAPEETEKTINEARKTVIDYMKKMAAVEWSPKNTIDHQDEVQKGLVFKPGNTYKGLIYTNPIDGTYEEFVHYLNDDNVYVGPEDFDHVIGVDCSSAVLASWARVSTSINCVYSLQMFPGKGRNGIIAVGDYDYSVSDKNSEEIVIYNGAQTMFKAYAELVPGDAVMTYINAGHVRMVTDYPHIEYLENGNISPRSYVRCTEITGEMIDGTTWRVDKKYYFSLLFDTAYIPLTCEELLSGKSEEAEIRVVNPPTGDNFIEKGFKGVLMSNYRMYHLSMQILDSNGKAVQEHSEFPIITENLKMVGKSKNLKDYGEYFDLASLESGKYTFVITALLPMGEVEALRFDFTK